MQIISTKERNTGISDVMSCGGIYLTFVLDDRVYGIELLKVRKIVGVTTPVPKIHKYMKVDLCLSRLSHFFPGGIVPYYVKGIIRLRERVIPIIDLRLRLGFQETAYTAETCIIIVDTKERPVGIIVDKILGTLDVKSEEIEDVSPVEDKINTEFFIGTLIRNEEAKILLDIDNILDANRSAILWNF
ncbi:MAG: purine-binding chemotaxis protein CheW [Candidatus Brocadia sp.]|jgi:purine-binding chemotaxis protein CheW